MIDTVGSFVHRLEYGDLPPEVVAKTKTCLLYAISIGLAGAEAEYPRIARNSLPHCPGQSTVLPGGEKTSSLDAALVNSVLFHSRTQEDTYAPGSTHPGAVVVPTALAVAESLAEPVDGRDFLVAVICGYETIANLSRSCVRYSTPRGFRATPVYGISGAAAAAAKLLRLDARQTANCLSFAANMSSGVTNSFYEGSMEWHFQIGFAARNGVLAALLAKHGAVGSPTAIEGRNGFLKALAGSIEPAEEIIQAFDTGRDYTFGILDVDFKPYPTCAWVMATIDMVREIRRAESLRADQVERVMVYVSPYEANYPGNSNQGPFPSAESATMSVPYTAALALQDGHVTLKGLYRYEDAAIHSLAKKVQVIPSDEYPQMTCRVEIHLTDGAVISRSSPNPPHTYRYSWDETRTFLEDLLPEMPGVSSAGLDRLAEEIHGLDRNSDMRRLLVSVTEGQPVG